MSEPNPDPPERGFSCHGCEEKLTTVYDLESQIKVKDEEISKRREKLQELQSDNVLKISNPCIICYSERCTVVPLPCHHLCCCEGCFKLIGRCPICVDENEACEACSNTLPKCPMCDQEVRDKLIINTD